jgi:hypothetical protein
MTRAISPLTMPQLGDASEWRRPRRHGAMYHAHTALGFTLCKPHPWLDRHNSETTDNLGDLQYWGCCPRCYKKAGN